MTPEREQQLLDENARLRQEIELLRQKLGPGAAQAFRQEQRDTRSRAAGVAVGLAAGKNPGARRHGHEPYAYLKDVLKRLPSTTTAGLDALLPGNWYPAGKITEQWLVAG